MSMATTLGVWALRAGLLTIAALTLPYMLGALFIQPHIENRGFITAAFVVALLALWILESNISKGRSHAE